MIVIYLPFSFLLDIVCTVRTFLLRDYFNSSHKQQTNKQISDEQTSTFTRSLLPLGNVGSRVLSRMLGKHVEEICVYGEKSGNKLLSTLCSSHFFRPAKSTIFTGLKFSKSPSRSRHSISIDF